MPDSRSFLFSLVRPAGDEPIKMPVLSDRNGGIEFFEGSGPRFASEDFNDLYVLQNGSRDLLCNHDLGGCFMNPEGEGRNGAFLTDTNSSDVTEMEVFKIDLHGSHLKP